MESLGIDSGLLSFKEFFQENFGGFVGGAMEKGFNAVMIGIGGIMALIGVSI